MERLTARDKKGRAYFDDDGALIRGANGTFHQKKDSPVPVRGRQGLWEWNDNA